MADSKRVEFGDFQTPYEGAIQVCNLLKNAEVKPKTIIEPTCGKGAFLAASLKVFKSVKHLHGFELNEEYIKSAKETLRNQIKDRSIHLELKKMDFFKQD